jgi:hypothetical protein
MRNLLKWRDRQLGIVPEISHVLGFSPQNEKMYGHFHALKVTLTGIPKEPDSRLPVRQQTVFTTA